MTFIYGYYIYWGVIHGGQLIWYDQRPEGAFRNNRAGWEQQQSAAD